MIIIAFLKRKSRAKKQKPVNVDLQSRERVQTMPKYEHHTAHIATHV
jgi:hypothetical protein